MDFNYKFFSTEVLKDLKRVAIITLIIGIGILQKENPLLGLSSRMDSYSQDLFNNGVKYLPPFVSESLYPSHGQNKISVLLLTDQTVDGFFSGKWPISYSAHGRILNALLRYSPKAVVIDFLWLNSEKPGAIHLIRKLKKFKQKKIPVYLTFRKPNELMTFWPELKDLVIPVSPRIATDPTDFVARTYTISSPNLPSPAVRVYQDFYDSNFPPYDAPDMQMFWGVKENPQNAAWMDQGDAQDTILDLFTNGFSAVKYSPPYTTTVLVRDLLNPTAETQEMAHADLEKHLAGKVIFYGAQVTGASDVIYTPKRELRSGIYYHAMAFDNLISLEGRYKSDKIKKNLKNKHHLNDITLHIVILLFPSILIYVRHYKESKPNQTRTPESSRNTILKLPQPGSPPSSKVFRTLKTYMVNTWGIISKWFFYRLLLYGWISFCVISCFYDLELAPRHWVGYALFAELSFYIDNIIRFENAKSLMENKSNA